MLWPSLHTGYMACNPYENISQDMNVFGENTDSKQTVTDIALEYGLVTDYTSMVVRDEMFGSLGIQRNNNQRVQTEQAAQQQRAQQPVVAHRVDTQQPMYSPRRASYGGGGALDGWMLLMLLPLLVSAMQHRKTV